jgi:hypothetical protein
VDQSTGKVTVSFNLTGPSGTTGFGNVTIPKTSVPTGATPQVYIDGELCLNQGYTEDANNYYVYYTTHFSTHTVDIEFNANATATGEQIPQWALVAALVVVLLVVLGAVFAVGKRARKSASS